MSAQRRPQHGKNRSRPRGWHRGRATGKKAVPILDGLSAAEAQAEVAAVHVELENRALADDAELWRALKSVSAFVPLFEVVL